MQFSNSLLVAGLIAFASASPAPEPTTPTAAQSQALIDDLQSYLSALATQPALLSLASSLATDTAALNTLQDIQQSLQADILNGQTPNTAFVTALPSPIASVIGSVYSAEISILTQDGFGDVLASATASSMSAAKTTTATASGSGSAKTGDLSTSSTRSASGSGSATAGSVSTSSTGSAAIEKGAAGALGVDMLRICGGLAVGILSVVMAL
ncbi:hypothetical protein DSL72_007945 [Monilinia vaccinii-corymbosi]|uniref:Uncharacterized protein n=1 Tax=Monilinia vaccinii-corymbosi TaxID=61207 RepID=A0A8A3PJC7_9HELO|nr:hypothetical protein DSL72_007945 [Monilinia vaccinii-corymbosi]